MLLAALSVSGVGCEDRPAARATQGDVCTLSRGRRLARLSRGSFDALALAQAPGGARVAWSAPEGSFVRALDPKGAPQGSAVRVGGRCEGGLALAEGTQGTTWLACLRPGAHASLLSLSPSLEPGPARELGPAGRDSHGIALVAQGDRVHVVYHDGTPGAYAVYWVWAQGQQRPAERQRLSDPAYAATAPHLTAGDGRWIASWAESRFDDDHATVTRVALKRQGETVRTLGETPLDRPDARVVWGADGPWLGFRSRRAKDRHPQVYVAHLQDDLDPRGDDPIRVGRANTPAAPVAQECGGQRFVHMSRLYGGERYLALYPLDDRLHSLGGGYQYYENGHDYEQFDAVCGDGGPLLVAAERPHRPDGGGAQLTSALLHCPETVRPHGCSFPCTSR